MKKVTRFFSLLLAIAMVLAMNFGTLSVMADNGGTYKITINGNATGHTYEAYQIFSGTLGDNKELGNIDWAAGIDSTAFLAALKDSTVITSVENSADPGSYLTIGDLFGSCTDAQSVADVLATYTNEESVVKAFADIAGDHLGTAAGSTDSYTYTDPYYVYEITGLTAGYYLVKDSDGTVSGDDAYTDFILRVVGDAVATPKSDTPEVVKKVADINDSTSTTEDAYADSADYDIGDDVPFQLTATVADNYEDYSDYVLTFHDVQDDGLTFNANSVEVTLDGTTLSTDNYVVKCSDNSNAPTDGCTFEIVVTLKSSTSNITSAATNSSVVVVTYTSELNKDAVIGSGGNDNTVLLEYSNNPNSSTDTGKTPEDTVTVFTFELLLNKVDPSGVALKGAGFTLYKYSEKDKEYVAVGTEQTNATSFAFKGLDDGKYMIKETTTPSGYNTIDPIYFTVESTHTDGDNPALETLTVTETDASGTALTTPTTSFTVEKDNTGSTISTDNGLSTVSPNSSNISADIENNSGAVLPSTGGMGTKIFYTLGGILVIGAGVLLIVKRRMRNA